MEIIKDVKGGTLRLTSTSLVERTGESMPPCKWRLALSSLSDAMDGEELPIYRLGCVGHATFRPNKRTIGCRTFDVKNWKKIMKAAGRK